MHAKVLKLSQHNRVPTETIPDNHAVMDNHMHSQYMYNLCFCTFKDHWMSLNACTAQHQSNSAVGETQ